MNTTNLVSTIIHLFPTAGAFLVIYILTKKQNADYKEYRKKIDYISKMLGGFVFTNEETFNWFFEDHINLSKVSEKIIRRNKLSGYKITESTEYKHMDIFVDGRWYMIIHVKCDGWPKEPPKLKSLKSGSKNKK